MNLEELQTAIDSPTALAQAFMAGFQLRGEREGWPESTMNEIANVIEVLQSQGETARLVANPNKDAVRRFVNGCGIYPFDLSEFVDGVVAAAFTPSGVTDE